MMKTKVLHGEILSPPKLRPPSQPLARSPMGDVPTGWSPPDAWRRMVPSGSAGGAARVPNVRWSGAAHGGWMKDPRSLAIRVGLRLFEDAFVLAWRQREWARMKAAGYSNPGGRWKHCLSCGDPPTHFTDTLAQFGDQCPGLDFCGQPRSYLNDTPLPATKAYVGPARLRYSWFDPTQGWMDTDEFVLPSGNTQPAPQPGVERVGPLPEEMPFGVPERALVPVSPVKGLQRAVKQATGVSVDNDGKVVDRPSQRVAVVLGPVTFVPDWASGTVTMASSVGSRYPAVPPARVALHSKAPDFKKKSDSMPAVVGLQVYHALTEASDAVDVLADSIPGKPCKKLPGVSKAACVLNNFSDIEWSVAVPGLIYDQLEDRLIAHLHQFGAGASREFYHGPNLTQMTQFSRQLKMLKADPLSVMAPGAAERAVKEFMKADDPRFGLGNTLKKVAKMVSY